MRVLVSLQKITCRPLVITVLFFAIAFTPRSFGQTDREIMDAVSANGTTAIARVPVLDTLDPSQSLELLSPQFFNEQSTAIQRSIELSGGSALLDAIEAWLRRVPDGTMNPDALTALLTDSKLVYITATENPFDENVLQYQISTRVRYVGGRAPLYRDRASVRLIATLHRLYSDPNRLVPWLRYTLLSIVKTSGQAPQSFLSPNGDLRVSKTEWRRYLTNRIESYGLKTAIKTKSLRGRYNFAPLILYDNDSNGLIRFNRFLTNNRADEVLPQNPGGLARTVYLDAPSSVGLLGEFLSRTPAAISAINNNEGFCVGCENTAAADNFRNISREFVSAKPQVPFDQSTFGETIGEMSFPALMLYISDYLSDDTKASDGNSIFNGFFKITVAGPEIPAVVQCSGRDSLSFGARGALSCGWIGGSRNGRWMFWSDMFAFSGNEEIRSTLYWKTILPVSE